MDMTSNIMHHFQQIQVEHPTILITGIIFTLPIYKIGQLRHAKYDTKTLYCLQMLHLLINSCFIQNDFSYFKLKKRNFYTLCKIIVIFH